MILSHIIITNEQPAPALYLPMITHRNLFSHFQIEYRVSAPSKRLNIYIDETFCMADSILLAEQWQYLIWFRDLKNQS